MAKKGKRTAIPKKKASPYEKPPPIPPGEVIQDDKSRKWKIGPSIGIGGFGEIYSACLCHEDSEGSAEESSYPYVVKIEPIENGPLFVEMHFYNRNCNEEDIQNFMKSRNLTQLGIPAYLGSGSHMFQGKELRFLVLERYGTDISKIFKEGGRFPAPTVFQLGLQVLDVLDYIHSRSYIHADIKGANILMGIKQGTENQAYLLDFGLAYRLVDGNYRPNPKNAHEGTLEYTSRDRHLGGQTMRGDLEILAYNMLQWLAGALPWETLDNPDKVHKMKIQFMNNVRTTITTDYPYVPDDLIKFFEYINTLDMPDKPNYTTCREIFESYLTSVGKSRTSKLEFLITEDQTELSQETNKKLAFAQDLSLSPNGDSNKIDFKEADQDVISTDQNHKENNKTRKSFEQIVSPTTKRIRNAPERYKPECNIAIETPRSNQTQKIENYNKSKFGKLPPDKTNEIPKDTKKKKKKTKENSDRNNEVLETDTVIEVPDYISNTNINEKQIVESNVMSIIDLDSTSELSCDVQELNVQKNKDAIGNRVHNVKAISLLGKDRIEIRKTKKGVSESINDHQENKDDESESQANTREKPVEKNKKTRRSTDKNKVLSPTTSDHGRKLSADISKQNASQGEKAKKLENLRLSDDDCDLSQLPEISFSLPKENSVKSVKSKECAVVQYETDSTNELSNSKDNEKLTKKNKRKDKKAKKSEIEVIEIDCSIEISDRINHDFIISKTKKNEKIDDFKSVHNEESVIETNLPNHNHDQNKSEKKRGKKHKIEAPIESMSPQLNNLDQQDQTIIKSKRSKKRHSKPEIISLEGICEEDKLPNNNQEQEIRKNKKSKQKDVNISEVLFSAEEDAIQDSIIEHTEDQLSAGRKKKSKKNKDKDSETKTVTETNNASDQPDGGMTPKARRKKNKRDKSSDARISGSIDTEVSIKSVNSSNEVTERKLVKDKKRKLSESHNFKEKTDKLNEIATENNNVSDQPKNQKQKTKKKKKTTNRNESECDGHEDSKYQSIPANKNKRNSSEISSSKSKVTDNDSESEFLIDIKKRKVENKRKKSYESSDMYTQSPRRSIRNFGMKKEFYAT